MGNETGNRTSHGSAHALIEGIPWDGINFVFFVLYKAVYPGYDDFIFFKILSKDGWMLAQH